MVPSASRRTLLLGAVGAMAGCTNIGTEGTPTSGTDNPVIGDTVQRGSLSLSSPAFENGEPIPEQYGHPRRNVNPPLNIAGVPADAASVSLVMDDPDAVEPAGKVWLHWLVWNIPPTTETIPEDWDAENAVQGTNDFGNRGYDGPDPPDGTHTYRFKLYALDIELELSSSTEKRAVGVAMREHVLAQTQLEGTYAPVG